MYTHTHTDRNELTEFESVKLPLIVMMGWGAESAQDTKQDFNVDCEFLFNERVGWTALSEPEATASARRKWFHGRDASQVNWAGAR